MPRIFLAFCRQIASKKPAETRPREPNALQVPLPSRGRDVAVAKTERLRENARIIPAFCWQESGNSLAFCQYFASIILERGYACYLRDESEGRLR
jgi:hypothetical protein